MAQDITLPLRRLLAHRGMMPLVKPRQYRRIYSRQTRPT